MSDFSLREAMAVLERTPAALDGLLRGLPDAWVRADEGPETWSPFDVVGHLIHGEETDWMPRVRRILECGTALPFDAFDRFAQAEKSKGRNLEELLDQFRILRAENLLALGALDLSPADLAKRGVHPAFGEVTLQQLLATWTVHDLGHVAQVSRVMAKRYGAMVGPWRAYLPVLDRS